MQGNTTEFAIKIYLYILVGIIGLVTGSFCNAWAYRIVHNDRITIGRSYCPACGHTLYAKDLIPVISWISLKGKCRYCGGRISFRYPLSEILSFLMYEGILYIFQSGRYGYSVLNLIIQLMILSILMVLSLVDIDVMEIPDRFIIAIAVLSVIRLFEDISLWKDMVFGILFIFFPVFILIVVMDKILGKETMGGGDLKLIGALSLYFSPVKMLYMIIVACVIGFIAAVFLKKTKGQAFPFGPALSLSAFICMVSGDNVINCYLSFF